MSVPVSGIRALSTDLGSFLMKAMLGSGGWGAEGLFEERFADAVGSTDLPSVPGSTVPFDHLGEESQPHGNYLPVLGKLGNRLIQK